MESKSNVLRVKKGKSIKNEVDFPQKIKLSFFFNFKETPCCVRRKDVNGACVDSGEMS